MSQVRARLHGFTWISGLLGLAVALAVPGAFLLLGDWWLEFPRALRIMLLLAWGAGALGAGWALLLRPLRRLPRGDALALFIERAAPSLRSRLISHAQLSRSANGPEGDGFVVRLQEDASRAAATLDPRTLVPVQPLRTQFARQGPLLLAIALWFAYALPTSGILLRRAFLSDVPVPRKTRLLEVTGPLTVGRGDEVTLRARAEGVLPDSGQLELRHGSGRVQRVPLDRSRSESGVYSRVLPGVSTTFHYRVRVHDAESEEFEVEVLPRPVLTNLVMTQRWPAYTGRPDLERRAGDLSLLQGSRLVIEGTANRSLSNAVLRLGGVDRSVPGQLGPADSGTVRWEVEMDDLRIASLTFELMDPQGIASRDSAVYAVEVVPDRPPQVKLLLPSRREELATRRGAVLVAFEAEDDVALGGLQLCHQAVGDTNGAPTCTALALEADAGAVVRRRLDWRVDSIRPMPAEGAMIEFWIEARDRKEVGGPGIGRSERYLLRVVSEAEKRADLLARAGDAIGRLGDVAQGQERLNEALGRIIMLRPGTP